MDFGIAKMIGPDDTQNLTQTGEVFGTPLYMSPEQCLGQKLDARSDIYSLGCVLYECVTGKPPFRGSNPMETIMMHVNGALPAFGNKVISVQLKSVLLKSLSKKPEERFQSASDLTEALTQNGSSVRAHFDSTMRLLKRGRRDDTSMGALVLIVLMFLSLVGIIIFLSVKFHFDNHSMTVQLIEERRNDPVAWVGKAQELELKGELIDAERAYRKAIEFKPDYKNAWLGLGNALKKQGRNTDAAAAFTRAGELKSDGEITPSLNELVEQAQQQLDKGKFAEATASYERATKVLESDRQLDPGEQVNYLRDFGDCFRANQQWTAAQKAYSRAERILNSHQLAESKLMGDIKLRQGIIALGYGDFDKAAKLLRRALALEDTYAEGGKESDQAAQAATFLAETISRPEVGNYLEAERLYARAEPIYARHTEVLHKQALAQMMVEHGHVLMLLKKFPQAELKLRQANIEVDKVFPEGDSQRQRARLLLVKCQEILNFPGQFEHRFRTK